VRGRGLAWLSARLQYWGIRAVGWIFAILVTFVVISALMPVVGTVVAMSESWPEEIADRLQPLVSVLAAIHDGWVGGVQSSFAGFASPVNPVSSGNPSLAAHAAAASQAVSYGLTPYRLLVSAGAYVTFAFLRRSYYSLRYGFADELLRMRMLIVVDPQMALVRQRLMLEKAVSELTEPMHATQGVNLFSGIQALSMLGKLPEREKELAHAVRKVGNAAVHPRHEDQRVLMQPGNAVAVALASERNLKRFLAWYRRHRRRGAMTSAEWERIRHHFEQYGPPMDEPGADEWDYDPPQQRPAQGLTQN